MKNIKIEYYLKELKINLKKLIEIKGYNNEENIEKKR